MQSQKSHNTNPHGGWFRWELKVLGLFLALVSFFNLVIFQNTSALFVPTLSATVDNSAVSVNGNEILNSANQTKEVSLLLMVNTNNRTGYTVTLNSETDENSLTNADSSTNAKIDSISAPSALNSFSSNTWGYKFGTSTDYSPIPALSRPAQILQTAEKTNGSESNHLSIGMKLGNNLESGNYKNKLIFSILTNRYDPIAKMMNGYSFNNRLRLLETATDKIEHFKKNSTAPIATINTVNVENDDSDYEIKMWLDPTDRTAYYYAEPEKVYLNESSWSMFSGMNSLTSLDLSNFDTSKVMDMSGMFASSSNLTSLDLSNFDTSKVTNMSRMFSTMFRLSSLNVSNFDTSKVTNMNSMFTYLYSLTSLNLSNFDTSKVMDMSNMFHYSLGFTSLNLSNFDTSNVTNMNNMFSNMRHLTSLDLSSFNTANVTDMSSMFSDMAALTSLNIGSFNTENVTDMNGMFANMSSIESLDLSSFNTKNVIKFRGMFYNDNPNYTLKKIYASADFETQKAVENEANDNSANIDIFYNLKAIEGGNGSRGLSFSWSHLGGLKIDRPGSPGYFTYRAKPN